MAKHQPQSFYESIQSSQAMIRQFKRQGQTTLVAISTYRPPGFATAAEQAGADAIIDAPFTLDVLTTAIRTGLEVQA
jgi:CheY-like chemotaxis protein